jgi:hypothetical protein
MPEPLWWQGLALIGAGTLAGGITATVNVWLLFHPKEPRRLGPFTVQGAIPRYQARLAHSVEQWVTEGLASQTLEAGARHFIAAQRDALLHDERPLLERLPQGLLAAVEQGITDYLPVAVEQFGATLEDPEARARITEALKGVLDTAVANLKAHERLVARLVVTPDRVDRMVSELSAVFASPEFKARISTTVNDAVMRFLRTPIAERLWTLGPDRLDGLERAASDYVVAALRAPDTADWASARAREAVDAWRDYPIGLPRSLKRSVALGFGLGAIIGALGWGVTLLLR